MAAQIMNARKLRRFMKKLVEGIPVLGSISKGVYRKWINPEEPFTGSEKYWIERYDSGEDSGDGSYGKLAEFKAEMLNQFVKAKNIKTIIEFGCGDGNQLTLADYPQYIGFDVSTKAISLCRRTFSDDVTKAFRLISEYRGEKAQLTLSLDVVFHLVEDDVFQEYMHRLFDSADDFVIVYSSNKDAAKGDNIGPHVRHRKFTEWVDKTKPEWKLSHVIPNRYPPDGRGFGSDSDFYIYEKSPAEEIR